jgi:TRAP-type C4-dicarboxylate transport system permease small subunit
MTVMTIETQNNQNFGGAMAWVSFTLGAFAAVVVAILAYTVLALPLWIVLLSYPVIGVLVALAVLLNLLARSEETETDESEADRSKFPKIRSILGQSDT